MASSASTPSCLALARRVDGRMILRSVSQSASCVCGRGKGCCCDQSDSLLQSLTSVAIKIDPSVNMRRVYEVAGGLPLCNVCVLGEGFAERRSRQAARRQACIHVVAYAGGPQSPQRRERQGNSSVNAHSERDMGGTRRVRTYSISLMQTQRKRKTDRQARCVCRWARRDGRRTSA